MLTRFVEAVSNLWNAIMEFFTGGDPIPNRTNTSTGRQAVVVHPTEDEPTETTIQGVAVPSVWEGPHGGRRTVRDVVAPSDESDDYVVHYTGADPDRIRKVTLTKFRRWQENATRVG